jgi:alpha-mannosidase
VRAHVRLDGTIDELAGADGVNVAALLNGLAAYVDKPKQWDAWNLDRSYADRRVPVKPETAVNDGDGVSVRYRIGARSAATLALSLADGEPYLRAELAVAWHEDHVVLRLEHRFAVAARSVRFGVPHGTIERSAYAQSDAERAQYEVPAQRWALVDDGAHGGALFAPDTYGWSAHGLPDGGVRLGMSLLRAPRWPDPGADRGEHRIAYAFVPTAGAPVSALEAAWTDYAGSERVRLFSSDDPAVLIVATKPADDGDGVIVRVRECDGAPRAVALTCGARMREALPVDACERPVPGAARIVEETLQFPLSAFGLRAFRVRF